MDQVKAIEERAKLIGKEDFFVYMFPDNGGLHSADITEIKKLDIDSRIAPDIHISGGGALEAAEGLYAANPDFH